MARVGLIWAAILVGAFACAAIVFDDPGIVYGAMNADMLWPASFVWDVATRADGWRGHSLARLPSLVPDVAAWAALVLATHSVRWTVLLYGAFQISALVAIGGWIAARLAGRAWVAGSVAVLAIVAALIGLALNGYGGSIMVFSSIMPIVHFGPLLMGLLGAALAANGGAAGGRLASVVALSAAVVLSDQLLLIEFVLPLLFATIVLAAVGRLKPSRVLRIVLGVVVGLVLGQVLFVQLRHAGVRADPAPHVHWPMVLRSLGDFAAALPGLVAATPAPPIVLAVAAIGFAGLGWWLIGRARQAMTNTSAETTPLFLWLFAAAACAASIVFTACFYTDPSNLRYAIGLWAWVVIIMSAMLLRVPGATAAVAPVAAAVVAVLLYVFAIVDRGDVAVLRWDYDIAACLRTLHGPLDLHAGLAEYWIARPTNVALRWTTQIDQITGIGEAYIWNSDPRWYRESFVDPAKPPVHDFIVMRHLNADGIRARFGSPDRVVACADTELWVYRNPAALAVKFSATLPDPLPTARHWR